MSIKSNRIKVKKKLTKLLSESKFAREDSAEFVVLVLDLLEDSDNRFEFKEIAQEVYGVGRRVIAITQGVLDFEQRQSHPLAPIASRFVREIQKTTVYPAFMLDALKMPELKRYARKQGVKVSHKPKWLIIKELLEVDYGRTAI